MKNLRSIIATALIALALCMGSADATTSTINPNVPAANSPLSSSTVRNNFLAAYNDVNALWAAAITSLTGDATATGPGASALTLATVNSNVGTVGSSTAIPVLTVNGKGLTTAASTAAVVAPAGTLTGTTLAPNVVSSSLTSLGTIISGVWHGSTISIPYGGTGSSVPMASNTIFYAGDSRSANFFIDSSFRNEGTYQPFNWANFLLGHPFVITGGAAASGTRTDQLFNCGAIVTGSISNSGSSYTNGTYYSVPLTGGSGALARATIIISGGIVTSVVITTPGVAYLVGDILSALSSNLGGTGSGFAYTVNSFQSQYSAALASSAKNIQLQDGVNDLTQQYPSSSTSGATACANIQTFANGIIAAGKRMILIEEYGSQNETSTETGQLQILRRCEEEYALSNPGNLLLVDFAPALYSPTNTSTTSVVFKSNYSTDGTHLVTLGAYNLGVYYKGILQTLLPDIPTPSGVVAAYNDSSTGGPQIATNPTFLNTSTITGITGITGIGPTGWTWQANGSASATVTMQANTDSNGIGNEAVVNYTCTSSSDNIQLYDDPSNTLWSLSGSYMGTGGAYVESGSTNMAVGIQLVETNQNAASAYINSQSWSMYSQSGSPGPTTAYSGKLRTSVITAPGGSVTQGYMGIYYVLQCTGSGTGIVHLRPTGIWTII